MSPWPTSTIENLFHRLPLWSLGRQSTQPCLVHPYRRHGTAFERTLRRSNCCRNLSNGALYWGSWGGPTLDVSSASKDIFTTAPTLSDSLVSGGKAPWGGVRGMGLGLGAELGNMPLLHAEWLKGETGVGVGVLPLSLYFLLSFHTCPTPQC